MGGRGKENYKFFPFSLKERENRARKKIAEARRVEAPRWSSEAAGRANQMKFDILHKRPAITERFY